MSSKKSAVSKAKKAPAAKLTKKAPAPQPAKAVEETEHKRKETAHGRAVAMVLERSHTDDEIFAQVTETFSTFHRGAISHARTELNNGRIKRGDGQPYVRLMRNEKGEAVPYAPKAKVQGEKKSATVLKRVLGKCDE